MIDERPDSGITQPVHVPKQDTTLPVFPAKPVTGFALHL